MVGWLWQWWWWWWKSYDVILQFTIHHIFWLSQPKKREIKEKTWLLNRRGRFLMCVCAHFYFLLMCVEWITKKFFFFLSFLIHSFYIYSRFVKIIGSNKNFKEIRIYESVKLINLLDFFQIESEIYGVGEQIISKWNSLQNEIIMMKSDWNYSNRKNTDTSLAVVVALIGTKFESYTWFFF